MSITFPTSANRYWNLIHTTFSWSIWNCTFSLQQGHHLWLYEYSAIIKKKRYSSTIDHKTGLKLASFWISVPYLTEYAFVWFPCVYLQSFNHKWHVHANPEGDDTYAAMGDRCMSLGGHYNPYYVNLRVSIIARATLLITLKMMLIINNSFFGPSRKCWLPLL